MNFFQRKWHQMSDLGLNDDLAVTYREQRQVRILNQYMFTILFFGLSFLVLAIIEEQWVGAYLAVVNAGVFAGPIFLNYYGKYDVARKFAVICIPAVFVGTAMMVGDVIHIEYTFFIILLLVYLLFDRIKYHIIFSVYIFLCILGCKFSYIYHIPFFEIKTPNFLPSPDWVGLINLGDVFIMYIMFLRIFKLEILVDKQRTIE